MSLVQHHTLVTYPSMGGSTENHGLIFYVSTGGHVTKLVA